MDGDWDGDNFEPKPISVNKWEGEDEEEDVCENWEDTEAEEKKDVEKQEPVKVIPKKKDKIKEEKQRQHDEAERKAQELPLTTEEKLAEKIRRQNQQEVEDLRVVIETFGISESEMKKEDFDRLRDEISSKLQDLNKSLFFPTFAEDLIRNICTNLSSNDLKNLKITIDGMYQEKLKIEGIGQKAKKKVKGKAKLRMEGENSLYNEYSAYGDYDDFEDFM